MAGGGAAVPLNADRPVGGDVGPVERGERGDEASR
jgi:hypothetical protein